MVHYDASFRSTLINSVINFNFSSEIWRRINSNVNFTSVVSLLKNIKLEKDFYQMFGECFRIILVCKLLTKDNKNLMTNRLENMNYRVMESNFC